MTSKETILVNVDAATGVAEVALNRPKKLNAMSPQFWKDLQATFEELDRSSNVRAIVLHQGECRIFSAGLDITASSDDAGLFGDGDDEDDGAECVARKGLKMLRTIDIPQRAISSLERCRKPVISVVDGACIGGGVDLICAGDIRYCTAAAYFCIKEVAVGLAADIGTLQRLPKVVGNDSLVRELAYTARNMYADEALKLGLVSSVLDTRQLALDAAFATAKQIAAHSPLAVLGTKVSLNYSRDHTTQEGLDHIALQNSMFLQSPDMVTAMMASMQKQTALFPKL